MSRAALGAEPTRHAVSTISPPAVSAMRSAARRAASSVPCGSTSRAKRYEESVLMEYLRLVERILPGLK